uniref:Ribonuclease H-like domain-containing protein n=1 Tax=Tanacetum cinerariifolium TaxID=118510 RepID=A0A699I8U9_TANCI|nr:ribonuclease H-like domain-containing protein [Tanacetum cinerariifolium]
MEGLGYSVVPPPPAQLYSPPKKDLSWTGLLEFKDDTVTDYSRPSPTIESSSDDVQNRNPSVTKTEASHSTISSKPFIKFVKAANRPTEDKIDKKETAKKPTVKYAKLYRRTSKSSKVRGNQRNWNNLKSQQLGENFVKKNKACFNCGHFDHLSYDCRLGVKIGRACLKNNNTHKSMPPRTVVHKTVRSPTRTNRSNMNVAQPRRINFPKTRHSYVKRPFQETTQDLMIILIQRVKMIEKELKARTSSTKVYKVDRGRSRPVMALVPKKGSSQNNIDDKGYWDSGCSRHMTGNISYLSDYEPFDGGYVSFGQGGCKITGKGTIKTECIVLGQNFKLSDDDNMLLRTPRQHNMYSIDLNNIFPHKDLTCLVAKASADDVCYDIRG